MKTAIVWFKTDLRLYDNEALIKAIEQGKFCLFIVLMILILKQPNMV
jgi:deoxyribodipyrimidine photolyase